MEEARKGKGDARSLTPGFGGKDGGAGADFALYFVFPGQEEGTRETWPRGLVVQRAVPVPISLLCLGFPGEEEGGARKAWPRGLVVKMAVAMPNSISCLGFPGMEEGGGARSVTPGFGRGGGSADTNY